jgi:hypothetical protein
MNHRLLQFFRYDHLPEPQQLISRMCSSLAFAIDKELPEGPEKTAGLRKLLEAKDCFVRATLDVVDDG